MSSRVRMSHQTLVRSGTARRRRSRLASAALLLVLALIAGLGSVLLPTAAYAGSAVGSFEIDGNVLDDSGAGEPIDWSTPPPNLTHFDDATGSGDDSFNTGSKETEPGGWDCQLASAPGKDDILSGDIAFRTVGGDQFVYVDYFRKAVNGDAHIDYEFNQRTAPNPVCPALPQRTNGDIIISFDTEQGGKKIFVRAFRWNFTGTSTTVGTLTELPTGSKGVTYDGAVNIPPALTIPGHTNGDFGEAALNLTKTIGAIACGQFSTAYMKSRASTSISAALKDRTTSKPVNVGECPNSALAKAVRNVTQNGSFATTATASPNDVIEYRLTYTNNGNVPATGVVVTDQIQPRQTFISCSNGCATNGPPVTSLTWNLGTVEARGTRVVTFQVRLDPTFPAGSTAINNVGVVDTNEEPPKTSPPTTVTVTANPSSGLVKSVRNVTDNGAFASTATADPGETLEYQLVYTNTGNADASNVTISDTIQPRQTFLSCTAACTTNGPPVTTVTWSLGTVAPSASRTVTFRVTLDPSFPAGTTQVKNVGVANATGVPPKTSNETVVTVTARPVLSLLKAADQTTVTEGGLITYTLSYANNGNAPATNVTIRDDVPAGTTYASCTGGCTVSGSTVTWTIPSVPPGGTGSVTLTVRVTASGTCQVCNSATIASLDQNAGTPVPSNTVCVSVNPVDNPNAANASGSATGARVEVPLLGLDETLPAGNDGAGDETSVDSSQSGVGSDSESASVLSVAIPPGAGPVLQADVLKAVSTSTVTRDPAQADATSVATAADVDVLSGVVRATAVRAVAGATATGRSATVSSTGSVIEGLMIDVDGSGPLPAVPQSVAPNTRVDLVPAVFGAGSYVAIYEEAVRSTTTPTGTTGGIYTADLTVNMIRVHITGLGLVGAVDVIVSQAVAHADFPQTTVCGAFVNRSVSGHAFILDAQTDPSLLPVTVGYVEIPASGGSVQQALNSAVVDTTSTRTAGSSSTGTVGSSSTSATSFAEAKSVCVLKTATGCTVGATALRSQANSTAGPTSRTSDATGSRFVGLQVAGESIDIPVPANTVIELPGGLGFVILNEQTCDNGGTLSAAGTCSGDSEPGHTGITVRAIRVILLDSATGGDPGAEVIVAEAHSDAKYL